MDPNGQANTGPAIKPAAAAPTGGAKPQGKTLIYAAGAIIAIILIGLIYVTISGASTPTVANGDTVKVYYTGTFTNGTVFDSNVGQQPLEFKVGAGQVIEGFDQAVIGMKLNETKTVTVPANQAYGEVQQDLIITVPKTEFGNQSIEVGMTVTQESSQGPVQGRVTAVNATNVTLDFNPLLAGQTLIFKITVAAINNSS